MVEEELSWQVHQALGVKPTGEQEMAVKVVQVTALTRKMIMDQILTITKMTQISPKEKTAASISIIVHAIPDRSAWQFPIGRKALMNFCPMSDTKMAPW